MLTGACCEDKTGKSTEFSLWKPVKLYQLPVQLTRANLN